MNLITHHAVVMRVLARSQACAMGTATGVVDIAASKHPLCGKLVEHWGWRGSIAVTAPRIGPLHVREHIQHVGLFSSLEGIVDTDGRLPQQRSETLCPSMRRLPSRTVFGSRPFSWYCSYSLLYKIPCNGPPRAARASTRRVTSGSSISGGAWCGFVRASITSEPKQPQCLSRMKASMP